MNKAEVYKRSDGLWDWRLKAANGQTIATSGGQGYTERNDATEALDRVFGGYAHPTPTEGGVDMERDKPEVNPDDREADGTREEDAPDYPVTTLPPKEREAEPAKEVGPRK